MLRPVNPRVPLPFPCPGFLGRPPACRSILVVCVVASQGTAPTLEALAADEEAADAQEAADTSCGVLEEGQADEVFLGTGQGSESKTNSVDL